MIERIPFEIHQEAEQELAIEKLQWLTNQELVEFLNAATDYVLEAELHMGIAKDILKQRGVDIMWGDEE